MVQHIYNRPKIRQLYNKFFILHTTLLFFLSTSATINLAANKPLRQPLSTHTPDQTFVQKSPDHGVSTVSVSFNMSKKPIALPHYLAVPFEATQPLEPPVCETSRGTFGISNVQFRVGVPPLRQLPLQTVMDSASHSISHIKELTDEIDRAVYDILKRNDVITNQERGVEASGDWYGEAVSPNLDRTDWYICSRSSARMPYSSYVTLLVVSPWSPSMADCWQDSARDLKIWIDSFLDNKLRYDVDVHIEIIDSWLYAPKYIAPIIDRNDLDADWEHLKSVVRGVLRTQWNLKDHWTCIALFHHGIHENATENPPTVYIGFDRGCEEIEWGPFRQKLQNFLDGFRLGLHIHLEHSETEPHAFQLRAPKNPPAPNFALVSYEQPYETKVNLGADISANTYNVQEEQQPSGPPKLSIANSSVGTLGCYVQIQFTSKGPWETFVLTNYHVVRSAMDGFKRDTDGKILVPPKTSALYQADHHGFKPNNTPSIGMEHPSRTRHNINVSGLEEHYRNETDPVAKREWKQLMDTKKAFFDNDKHVLGSLFAGSGFTFRTPSGGMLDWALIRPLPGRIGRNTLPGGSDWPSNLTSRPSRTTYGAELKFHERLSEEKFKRELVFKYGALSGATCGRFSVHNVDVRCSDWAYMIDEEDRRTTEYAFLQVGAGSGFGGPGDSGSVVWNANGHAWALLHRGQPSKDKVMFTYITPMEHVFQHIQSFLGVKGIRIYQ